MTNPSIDLERALQRQVEDLTREYAGVFSAETVARCVYDSAQRMERSSVIEYIPVLSYRFARERLKASAQVGGTMPKEQPDVLFVCVHNAGRSQMAAGLTHVLSG